MSVMDWTGISYPFRIENGSVAKSKSVLQPKDGKSEHISESISLIVSTTFGEWITANHIGTKFRSLVFKSFSYDFDAYITYNLTKCIEEQDPRVKVNSIDIVRNDDKSSINIIVKWDINKDVIKTQSETSEQTTTVSIEDTDTESG